MLINPIHIWFLFLLTLLPSSGVSKPNQCHRLSWFLENTAPNKLAAADYQLVYGDIPPIIVQRMRRAEDAVLKTLSQAQVREVAGEVDMKELSDIGMQWLDDMEEDQSLLSIASAERPLELAELSDSVFQFSWKDQSYVMRRVSDARDDEELWSARRSFMASLVDAAFGYNVIPDTKIARLNGKTAVVADYVEGSMVVDQRNQRATEYLAKKIRSGALDQKSLWIAQAILFLVGNDDSDGTNLMVTANGSMVHVDQGIAFSFGSTISPESRMLDSLPLGHVLPERYSRRFIKQLVSKDSDFFDDLLFDHASEEELRRIKYRRRLILADVELRGEGVFFE